MATLECVQTLHILPGSLTADETSGTPRVEQTVDKKSLGSMADLAAQVASGAEVRMEKVLALQQAIASGTYHVSALDVADKMVESLLSQG